jgi:hypothetical protein
MQGETKTEDQEGYLEVKGKVDGIYQQTEQDVQKILNDLDKWVPDKFDTGASVAKDTFVNYVDARKEAYREKRYSGAEGALKWGRDLLMGMPDEVNAFYQEGVKVYIREMDRTLTGIAKHIAAELNRAKARVAEGRQQIKACVANLSPQLRENGQKAIQEIQGQFDELEGSIDSKRNELVNTLSDKYNEGLDEVNTYLEQQKEEDKGLVDKAKDTMGNVVSMMGEMREQLQSALASAAGAVMTILKDPIGFLGNLIDAVGQGLNNFAGNILTHLKNGFIEWLTGAVSAANIKMPASLDGPGILSLVMQVLGLTYEHIRGQIVKALGPKGEELISALEQSWEVLQIVATEGLAGLWQFVQQFIGDIKAMVIDAIQSMIAQEVIQAGIKFLVKMLGGPAGAFIQAVEGIVALVSWFAENASKMASLAAAVLNSVSAIASGAICEAASFVENSLAKALPMAIGFLADLMGLGDIADRVQGIIKKAQQPINSAVEWVVKKARAMAKKIAKKLGLSKDEEEGEEDEDHDAKVEAGLSDLYAKEASKAEGGGITLKEAQQIAASVKAAHPIFKTLTVVDGGDTWNYDYVASPGEV